MRVVDEVVLPGVSPPRKPEGGYRLIEVRLLARAWWSYRSGKIGIEGLRTWFACQEAVATRCRLEAGRAPIYSVGQIQRLTGIPEKRLRGALRRLEEAGLLVFSESEIKFPAPSEGQGGPSPEGFAAFFAKLPNRNRRVPVPRRTIRLLAGGAAMSLIATILGHLLRCLYYRNGGCESRGTCKASWIAETFGISLRAAKAARKHLVDLKWLLPTPTPQWRMNRYGLTMTVNLGWSVNPDWARLDGVPTRPPAAERGGEGGGHVSAPPPAVPGPVPAPPESDRELSRWGSKNQEPAPGSGGTGFLSSRREPVKTPGMVPNSESPAPRLSDVKPEDLRDTARTLELFRQATEAGIASPSEADRLRFVAAAEHARVIGTRNPCGLFVRIVRSKLWSYLTQDDEDAASARLKKHLFGGPPKTEKALPCQVPVAIRSRELSTDARIVREVRAEAARAGYRGDPFLLLRRHDAAWTRERFDRAAAEFGNAGATVGVPAGGVETLAEGILGRLRTSQEG